ncbi:MAG: flagellar hook protein FlgE [Tissierellia bacterium]|nr:flagellar hook protein FlgE [Tissierellia bacterium]
MMRSMYAGVSGLRVHQNKMDVIGNNIANVNTVAFKRGQMTFQEVFSETVRGASAPQAGKGGTNPQQIGLGVAVGSTNIIHTKGALQTTGNATDLMIDGEGFFVVSDDSSFENRYYTRAGDFTLDRDGNLVTSEGYKVLGYQVDADDNITSEIGAIRINKSETKAPTATSNIMFRGNLNSEAMPEDVHITDTVINDSLGNSYTISFKFTKVAPDDDEESSRVWELSVDRITQQSTGNYTNETSNIFGDGVDRIRLSFDSYGNLNEMGYGDDELDVEFDISLMGLSDIQFNFDRYGGDLGNGFTVPSGTLETIKLFDSDERDTYRHLIQYANDMDAKPYVMDGNSSGKLDGYSIGPDGLVEGIFTNGERKALGQIMLAKFDNGMGLEKLGNNLYSNTRNSGEPQLGKAGSSGYGPIASGSLEMSNVDLSMEFTEMITTQRGFQANSRIITTSDEMLQELVNIKR